MKNGYVFRKGNRFCYRCGDPTHLFRDCCAYIKCFRCGCFGHKKIDCSLNFNSTNKLSITDYGFHFVLKFIKLKRILIDHLWSYRKEGLEFLEDLLVHFNAVNEVNIGNHYNMNFGDSANCSGEFTSSSQGGVSAMDENSNPNDLKGVSVDFDSIIFFEMSDSIHMDALKCSDPILWYPDVLGSNVSLSVNFVKKDLDTDVGSYVLDDGSISDVFFHKANHCESIKSLENIDTLPGSIKRMLVQSQNFELEVPSTSDTLNRGNSDLTEVIGCVEDYGVDYSKCSDNRTKKEVIISQQYNFDDVGERQSLDCVVDANKFNCFCLEDSLCANSCVVVIEEEGNSFVDDIGLTDCAFTVNKGNDVISGTVNTIVGDEQSGDSEVLNLVCYVGSRDTDISKYAHHSAVSQCTHCISRVNRLNVISHVVVVGPESSEVFAFDGFNPSDSMIRDAVQYRDGLVIFETVGSFVFDLSSLLLPLFENALDVMNFKNVFRVCGLESTLVKYLLLDNVVDQFNKPVCSSKLNGSEGNYNVDHDANGLENNIIVSNAREDLKNSNFQQSDKAVYYWTGGFRFVMYCYLVAIGKFPRSPAHARELIRAAKLRRKNSKSYSSGIIRRSPRLNRKTF